jgi:hypothetical protein
MFATKQTRIKEKEMSTNLPLYHEVLEQLCQWLPSERITRLRNMALLLVGMQQAGGIHLSLIVRKWPGIDSKEMSLVNRLRRFLNNHRVRTRLWYEPLLRLILESWSGQEIRLIIDCTKVGFNFRLLTISLAYKKRALPLVWSVHRGRKGHVGYQQQLALFNYLAPFLPENAPVWVMGDAGFESVYLLGWLKERNWHFVLRHPGKNQVRWPGQPWVKLGDIPVTEGQTHYIGWVHLTEKHDAGPFWLVIHWAKGEDEPWYLISDTPDKHPLINRYRIRMWTEEMYGDMKGHGFDIESTHLDDADRISRLFLAVCINFVWFITLGSWVVKRGFRHFVDHKSRRDKSYFRIGWDWIERCARLGRPIPIRFKPLF